MPSSPWTIQSLIHTTAGYFERKGVDNPRLNAEVLLAHLLGCRRLDLYLRFDQPLREDELDGYRELVRRRALREPLQYIRGLQEFWSLDFEVGPGVLIPRPETEILLQEAFRLMKGGRVPGEGTPRVLDLGTGTGVLAVCTSLEMAGARVWASDCSQAALDTARKNAGRHNVAERIRFVRGDLLAPFRQGNRGFDLILSNPPYVGSEEFEDLEPEVRDHEPRQALDGGPGGMEIIRRILTDAPFHLSSRGRLLVEMDPRQMDEALETADTVGVYDRPEPVRDYHRRYRVLSLAMGRPSGGKP